MIDVVRTELQVVHYGDFRLEHFARIDHTGGYASWSVWCVLCGCYAAEQLPTDWAARAAADLHEHADAVTVLQRMRHEIPPLLDGRGVA